MRLLLFSVLALGPLVSSGCTPMAAPTESDAASCSNGRDDDGDSLVDCRDPACTIFPFCGTDAGMPDAPSLDAGALDAEDTPPACAAPLDLVLVLDVSSTMEPELAAIREVLPALWATAHGLDPAAQLSLTVFVDDVFIVNDCAPFGSVEDLTRAVDSYRMAAPMNRGVANPDLVNRDCPENSLDALFDSATMCPFRTGSTRVILHATDDTFVERPGVLSGEWGGGLFVQSTYAEVSTALVSRNIHVGALAWSGAGEFCGAGTSPDTGQGFHTPFGAQLTLPMLTGGSVWDGRALRSGSLNLSEEITALLGRVHPCGG